MLPKVILANLRPCLCLLLAAWVPSGYAQQPERPKQPRYLFQTQVINVEDGLPDRFVYDVVQDHDGFIWISTPEGISRYDGYRFKTIPNARLGLAEGVPSKIVLDAHNRIWYTERRRLHGVCVSGILDLRADSLFAIQQLAPDLLAGEQVQNVYAFPAYDSAVLVLTYPSGILYRYNGARGGTWEELFRLPEAAEPFTRCQRGADGSYWLVSYGYARRIRPGETPEILQIPLDSAERENLTRPSQPVPSVLTIQPGNSGGPGRLLTLDTAGNFPPLTIPGVPAEELHDILHQHADYTCYRTGDELRVRDREGKLLYAFRQVAEESQEMTLQTRTTLVDRHGYLWIGTENGLLKLSAQRAPFTLMAQGNSIRGIYEGQGATWVSGYQGKSVTGLPTAAAQAFAQAAPTVMSFFKGARGKLWMGTDSGSYLLSYDPATGQVSVHRFVFDHPLMLPYENPQTGNLWIGTRAGVYRVDVEGGAITDALLPAPGLQAEVRQFYQNQAGIWVVSSQGLFLLDAATEQVLAHYGTQQGFPFTNLNHLHEDPAAPGTYWLGTRGGGLLRWEPATNSMRQFTRAHGLSNNNIYAVYGDTLGNLWLASDYGLMCFDKQAHTTRVFLPRNGIAHEEFNTFSHFQAADGRLYFGGLNGVTAFYPAEVLGLTSAHPPLYATQVRVLAAGAEELTDRTAAFEATGAITLLPSDGMLELDISFLDYENAGQNQYGYQITDHQNAGRQNAGHQDRWVYTSTPTLTFLNLPYGTHTLKVQARGASGTWSQKPLAIPLRVLRPVYLRPWFLVLVSVGLILATVGIVRWRLGALERDRRRLEREVQKRTKQLAEQAEELKALDEAKTRFFSNITHEFRTPLTLVLGPLDQMLGWEPAARMQKGLRQVQKNAQSLLRLINQLLDIAKLEDRRMHVEVARGNLVAYTHELVEQFRALAQRKQLTLTWECERSAWELHFDQDKWHKIVYNLLANALKFTPAHGSVTVRLLEETRQGRPCAALQVADTGVGIPAETLPHIFDRFYQANDSSTRTAGGTGIGLALVKEFVELLQGEITVESTEGEGTTFTVMLPAQDEAGALATAAAPEAAAQEIEPLLVPLPAGAEAAGPVGGAVEESAIGGTGSTLSLLLIEDHADMRDYIRSCVPAGLYTLTEAADGEEGIRLAQELVPDLIISDVMMPKKDGFEVTQAIRTHRATSHIPLILLTAKASLESRLEGLRRGADAYLTKPFSPAELALRIQKLIEIRQLLQARYQWQGAEPSVATPATPTVSASPPDAYEQEDQFMGELFGYIHEHLSNAELGPDELARGMGMSRSQLYRKIKTLTGHALGELLRGIRCDEAMKRIQQGGMSLSEVAYQTGFSSLSHFSRTFKKVYGMPPSEVG